MNRSRITSLGPIVLGVIFFVVGGILGKDQTSDANTASNTASKIMLTVGFLLVVIGVIALVVRTFRARRST
jgi:heme/copper-type cytochrome/quinol oxidase subunit 2